ncbi:uncharacterized protein LOC135819554 [Sycon ciliatum]|uniref:uncharacterized protein LOC135819554 n=1 Tax=Sycon ciliatum TaxID=27933 RepID=UPI0031F6198A
MYKLSQGNCNAGYYEFRGLCWLFQDTNVYDFDTSQVDCKSKGGNLAAIRDSYDSSFIVRYRAEKFPLNNHTQVTIGYKKTTNLFGQFRWQDESCPSYSSWGCGEPDNAGSSGELCAQYQFGGETGSVGFTGKWSDYDCKTKTNYICQVPLPNSITPSTLCAAIKCEPGWVSWRGNCYKFVTNDSANWPSAYEKCLKMNSALLSISDFTEEAWVTQQLKKFNFPAEKKLWIGLNDQKYQVYRWPDDTAAFYRNWDCDVYANWAKQCIYIFAGFRKVGPQRTGKWGPDSCSSGHTSYNKDGYICESSPANAMGNIPIYTQGNCDPGWVWFRNRCYYFSQDKVDFPTAQGKCGVFNARLGVINTQAKNNFVVDYMIGNWSDFTGERFWIGLHRQAKQTDPFTWVNRTEPVVFTNYNCGEPNNAGGKEGCIEFVISNDFSNSASWNDVECTSSAHYICDKVAPPPTTMPTTIPPTTTVPTTTPRPTTTAMPTTRAPTTFPGTTTPPTEEPTSFGKPGIARSFAAKVFANSTIRLSWNGLDVGTGNLSEIVLQYRKQQHKRWAPLFSLFPTATSWASYTDHAIDVSNIMDPGTYTFRLAAHNNHGRGKMTESNPVAIFPERTQCPGVGFSVSALPETYALPAKAVEICQRRDPQYGSKLVSSHENRIACVKQHFNEIGIPDRELFWTSGRLATGEYVKSTGNWFDQGALYLVVCEFTTVSYKPTECKPTCSEISAFPLQQSTAAAAERVCEYNQRIFGDQHFDYRFAHVASPESEIFGCVSHHLRVTGMSNTLVYGGYGKDAHGVLKASNGNVLPPTASVYVVCEYRKRCSHQCPVERYGFPRRTTIHYIPSKVGLTYSEARTFCKDRNMRLPSFNDRSCVNNYLTYVMGTGGSGWIETMHPTLVAIVSRRKDGRTQFIPSWAKLKIAVCAIVQ